MSKPSKLRLFAAAALLVFAMGQALCLLHYEHEHEHGDSDDGNSCTVCSVLHQAAVLELSAPPSLTAPVASEVAASVPEAPVLQVRILSAGPRSPPASDAV